MGSVLVIIVFFCVSFLFCFSLFYVLCLMLPVALDCPFLIVTIFSNVYFLDEGRMTEHDRKSDHNTYFGQTGV